MTNLHQTWAKRRLEIDAVDMKAVDFKLNENEILSTSFRDPEVRVFYKRGDYVIEITGDPVLSDLIQNMVTRIENQDL